MKKILINLRELSFSQSVFIIDTLRFLPERKDTHFILIGDTKNAKRLQALNLKSASKDDFLYSVFEENNNESPTLSVLTQKYECQAVLNFNQLDENDNISGFNQIITPLLDIIYFAEENNNEYYIPDENVLAISLKKLCIFLKEKQVTNIMFLSSQISFYYDIENYIIERLNKDFETTKINLTDLKDITDISSRNLVTLFPQNIFSLIRMFIPATYADLDHRYEFPLIEIDLNQREKSVLKQNIRYATTQLIHLIDFKESNPNNYAYKSFADIYDYYMDHVTYHKWADFVVNHYQLSNHKKPERILDLACGTASISKILVDKKYNVVASDQSPEMLDIALEKSEKIELFQADMTEFSLNEKADLIVLLFDSINYLNTKEQISKLFQTIENNLSEKGMFIFDISTQHNSIEYFDGFVNIEEYNKHFFIHRADYLPHKKRQDTQLNIFTKSFLGYRREDEIHQQRVWKTNEILDLINLSHLTLTGIYDLSLPDNLINENTNRIDTEYSRIFFILSNEKK